MTSTVSLIPHLAPTCFWRKSMTQCVQSKIRSMNRTALYESQSKHCVMQPKLWSWTIYTTSSCEPAGWGIVVKRQLDNMSSRREASHIDILFVTISFIYINWLHHPEKPSLPISINSLSHNENPQLRHSISHPLRSSPAKQQRQVCWYIADRSPLEIPRSYHMPMLLFLSKFHVRRSKLRVLMVPSTFCSRVSYVQ